MNERKTPIPEPTVMLPRCLVCERDMLGPGSYCGRCLVFADIPEYRNEPHPLQRLDRFNAAFGCKGRF